MQVRFCKALLVERHVLSIYQQIFGIDSSIPISHISAIIHQPACCYVVENLGFVYMLKTLYVCLVISCSQILETLPQIIIL